jgi:hypothetical protein
MGALKPFDIEHPLISPRTAGVENDLPFDNPLTIILPPGTRSVAACAVPIVADLALELNLTDTILSPGADAVRDLDQLKDVLLCIGRSG